MVLLLICHMADSSAKPGSPAVTRSGTADSSMWLALLLPPLEVFWGWTGSVSLHAINLPLGLPKMLSQLLVADIFQLPVWNRLWGLTTEFCVCLWVVSWEWEDKIAFFSHCAHCGYSSKGWGCFYKNVSAKDGSADHQCVLPQCHHTAQVVTLEQWDCIQMPVHLCCSAFPPNHDSHPPASTSDAVSVPGGRGFGPHQCQHIQCIVTWYLSEFPAANEAAIVGQLQQKSQIHLHNFLLLDSAHTVLFQRDLFQGNV